MRTAVLTLVALAALAVGILVVPPALASASGQSAAATISQLEAEGFSVNVDRVGSAPLSDCAVTSVRNPQEQTRFVGVGGHGHRHVVEVVVHRSISVSLDCSSR